MSVCVRQSGSSADRSSEIVASSIDVSSSWSWATSQFRNGPRPWLLPTGSLPIVKTMTTLSTMSASTSRLMHRWPVQMAVKPRCYCNCSMQNARISNMRKAIMSERRSDSHAVRWSLAFSNGESRLPAASHSLRRYASTISTPSDNKSSQSHMHASRKAYYAQRNRSLLLYTAAVLVLGVGVTYASVPLYRLFCSATGFGE